MTIATTDPAANAGQVLMLLRAGIIFFVPILVVLRTWEEHAKPSGITLRDCLSEITARAVWYGLAYFAIQVVAFVFYRDQFETFLNIANGYSSAPLPGIVGGLAVPGLLWFACWYYPAMGFVNNMAGSGVSERLSGALVIDGSANQKQDAKWRAKFKRKNDPGKYIGSVLLGGLSMPPEDEMYHTLIVGSTGQGKSVAMRGLIKTIVERARHTGERMMILDPEGDYTARFYDAGRGDCILQPFDPRSAAWAIFKDIREPYDSDNIAAALVPDPGGEAGEWARKARTVVSGTLERLRKEPGAKTRDVYECCCLSSVSELRELLAKTPAARFHEQGNERTMLSILTTVNDALGGLRYLQGDDNFSIKDWVNEGKGWLFLPYKGEQIEAIRSIFRTWVRTAIFSALSLPVGDNRLWFLIDEFDALGKLEGLKDALPRLRKFGGRVVFGLQTIGMVESLYGRGDAGAIVENATNQLLLRSGVGIDGKGTSHFASGLIGQKQVRRIVHSTNTSSGSGSSSSGSSSHRSTTASTSEQFASEDAVTPTDIAKLPKLTGYLKFASQPEWQHITLPIDE